jgi:hypothetical protein
MLMCSAPVYHDVIDEWKHAGRPGRRKKKEKKLGELPSYLQGMHGPDKSRSEDLSGVRIADAGTCSCASARLPPHSCCLMLPVACSLPLGARSCLRRARLASGVEQLQVRTHALSMRQSVAAAYVRAARRETRPTMAPFSLTRGVMPQVLA